MKTKLITSILLFISAYSPLFLILIVKDFNFEEKSIQEPAKIIVINNSGNVKSKEDSIRISKIIKNVVVQNTTAVSSKNKFNHPIFDGVITGVSVLCIILLFVVMKKIKAGSMVVTVVGVKSRSLDIINYTIPYLFCAFDINTSKPEDIITVAFFLLILLILTINTQSIFINPILAMGGYAFYDLEYEFDKKTTTTIAISKFHLKKGERFNIRSLTPFLYFVKEEEKIENDAAKTSIT